MNKAYAYLRVSTKKQVVEGISLDSQKMALAEWAKTHNYQIVQYFIEKGKTGTNTNRPMLKKMLEYANVTKPHAIVTYQSDRLNRNTKEQADLRDKLRSLDIKLLYTTLDIDVTTSNGKLVDNIIASVNEFQSDNIKLKTSDSMLAKAKSGWPPKEAPIGYKNIKNPSPTCDMDKKIVVIDPHTGKLIKNVFELYATSEYSYEDLVKYLNDKKVKPKRAKKCCNRLIEFILKNKFYTGTFKWAGVEHIGKYEPLISNDLFNRVQDIRHMRNHYACRKRKHRFLLKGFLFYKDTKGRAYGEFHPDKSGNKIGRYFDSTSPKSSYITCEKLENQVTNYMRKIELSTEFTSLVMIKIEDAITEKRSFVSTEKKSLIARKTELENALRNLEDDRFIKQTVSTDRFTTLYNRYGEELLEVEHQLNNIDIDYSSKVKEAEKILRLAENIGETYANATYDEKRQYLHIFIKKLWVKNGYIVSFELNDNIKQLIKAGSIRVNVLWGG